MVQKEVVLTDKAPAPLPFYSQAIKCQGMVYCSGSIGMDPVTNKVIEGGVADRTTQALNNLAAILEAAGSSIDNVVKVNVFLTNMENFAAMNKVYESFFSKNPKPVRTCVAVYQLPLGTDVEIELTAHLRPNSETNSANIQDAMRSTPNSRSSRGRAPTVGEGEEGFFVDQAMSRAELRRRQAEAALQRLQAAQDETWTETQLKITEENLGILMNAVSSIDAPPARSRSRAQSQSRSRAQFQSHGQKRSRGDSDAGNFRIAPDEDSRPLFKRLRSAIASTEEANNLVTRNPQPIQIHYEQQPLKDRDDNWFVGMFEKLFDQTSNFAEKFFLIHDLNSEDWYQPWAQKFSPEFLHWTRQVAEEDPSPGNGSWDDLLRDTTQRKYFVMAILVRIFHEMIFNIDLWGADPQQKELLLGIDRAFFNREGFARTALRSETVCSIVGRGPVTQYFYQEVATLTAQLFLLLKPLTDYLYAMAPPKGTVIPSIVDQYQALHDLVSNAAYLSICVRLSPTIFFWVDVTPGTYYDRDDHTFLDIRSWTQSKQNVVDFYNSQVLEHKNELAIAENVVKDLEAQGKGNTRRGRATRQRLVEIQTVAPKALIYEYRAMAKISVWPSIKRFKPGSAEDEKKEREDPGNKIPLYKKNGSREFEVSKGAIVVYYGKTNRRNDERRLSLAEFVRQKQKEWPVDAEGDLGLTMKTAIPVAVLAASVGYWVLGEQVKEKLGFDFGSAVEFVGDLMSRVR
ncbi:hypothetical protein G7Y89_g3089 [Cudoniella acicularis]|uniref:Uncharacterized protein n=1 Tax=Cudoniella acicularis TaxID=354080 RepID=A0A8H4W5W8_9HELO|nr:hypothetical protein G7Y89_g3089 [Cudoniella acicularis]